MNASESSPSPKRVKLDPSLAGDGGEQPKDDAEQEHCTICLQSFLDRTIIPVCAHEFCFECILLWSEQSRKCPLCSRSFDDAYLIHHVRSQHDYQKYYLPPRSSPPPPLTGESRATALRNTRRQRQWGRRQRQHEEADQLERAIARRRWIYHHHLYAKHVASNPYTRYRPFPTPAQFTASPDLISRMTTFLRRELRVWPNSDVEFLTTYTISLMKSIDIRSESAVKLLSEFLDLDTPYTAGARHVNAEHFAHEIYSYLRSPYRDLKMYDQMAQYDTPPEISPPREIERGSRWSAIPTPSSRPHSHSRPPSPISRLENTARHSPTPRRRDTSTDAFPEDRPHHRHDLDGFPPGREEHHSRHRSSTGRHSPLDGVTGGKSDRAVYPEGSSAATQAESRNNDFPIQHRPEGAENGNDPMADIAEEIAAAADSTKMSPPRGDDSAALLAVNEAGMSVLINGPSNGTIEKRTDYVDGICDGSSANPQSSRKRLVGCNVHRNRTLSESVQAYLSRPTAPWCPPKTKNPVTGDKLRTGTAEAGRTDTRPRLLQRLTDGPSEPHVCELPSTRRTTVERTSGGDPFSPNDVPPSGQFPHTHGSSPCLVWPQQRTFATGLVEDAGGEEGVTTRVNGVDGTRRPVVPSSSAAALSDNTSPAAEGSRQSRAIIEARRRPEGALPRACIRDGTAGPPSLGDDDAADHARGRTDLAAAMAREERDAAISGERRPGRGSVVDLAAVGDDDASGGGAAAIMMASRRVGTEAGVAVDGVEGRPGSGADAGVGGGNVGDDGKGDVDGAALALERRLRARARVRVRLGALKSALEGGSVDVSGDAGCGR